MSSLREFVRHPLDTAAVAGDPVVVQLGPGTGALTRAIQERSGGRVRHIAVELNLGRVRLLTTPRLDDARELPVLLADRRIPAVDGVVSGLPWVASSPGPDGRDLHAAITDAPVPRRRLHPVRLPADALGASCPATPRRPARALRRGDDQSGGVEEPAARRDPTSCGNRCVATATELCETHAAQR